MFSQNFAKHLKEYLKHLLLLHKTIIYIYTYIYIYTHTHTHLSYIIYIYFCSLLYLPSDIPYTPVPNPLYQLHIQMYHNSLTTADGRFGFHGLQNCHCCCQQCGDGYPSMSTPMSMCLCIHRITAWRWNQGPPNPAVL